MIKLLIFDLDGTLVDSAPSIVAAVNSFMTANGRAKIEEEKIKNAIGSGLRSLVFSLLPETANSPKLLETLEADFLKHYRQYLFHNLTIWPGVEDFLANIHEKIVVVTNKHEQLARETLSHLKLDRFPWLTVIGGDTLPEKKPHPLPLLESLSLAGVKAHEALMIGDGEPDVMAAKACGIEPIALTFGYGDPKVLQRLGAKHFISSFYDLRSAINAVACK